MTLKLKAKKRVFALSLGLLWLAAALPSACGGGDDSQGTGGGNGKKDAGKDSSLTLPDGIGGPCTPRTCGDIGATCGPQADGCGDVVQGGSCTAPEFCGGGGPSKCGVFAPDGGPICTPITCQSAGADGGPIGDGCGGLIATCGTCTPPAICGGGGKPSSCGGTPDGGTSCVNFCKQQVSCDGG